MPLRPQQLEAQLQQGLAPIYLIAGGEPLLVQECCDQIREAAKQQGFLERDVLQVERGFDWSGLGEASAPSLFSSRRIVDLRIPTGKPGREGAKVISEWAASPDPDTLLLISCHEWDASSRKSKWASNIDKSGTVVEIWPIKPHDLPRWIQTRMQRVGLQPDNDALLSLVERVEGNLLAANQEIEKLLLLKGAGPVTEDDVLQGVANSSRFDAFRLVECGLVGNLSECLRVASGLKAIDTPMPMIIGALMREVSTLQAAIDMLQQGTPESTIFSRLNIWRNRQPAMRKALQRMTEMHINRLFQRLSVMDRQSKGQAQGDPWQSLNGFLVVICQNSRRRRSS